MSTSLSLQKAIKARLDATTAVTDLVPPTSIVDRHGTPATFPSIVIGEDQETDAELTLGRDIVAIFSTLHLWSQKMGMAEVKQIAGAVKAALTGTPITLDEDRLMDLRVADATYLRDPDGKTSHGVLKVETLVELTGA